MHLSICCRFAATARGILFTIVVACGIQPHQTLANDQKSTDSNPKLDPIQTQLLELGEEYMRVQDEQERILPNDATTQSDDSLTNEQWLAKVRLEDAKAPDPDQLLCPRMMKLAKENPDSPFAFDALFFVIRRGGPQTGDIGGKPWQLKEEALDVVAQKHMHDPRIVVLLEKLSGSFPSKKTLAFYRNAMDKGPSKTTRAAATLHFANHLRYWGKAHERSLRLKKKKQLRNFERFWDVVVTPYFEKEFPYNQEKITAEVERLLDHVVANYADVQATDWKVSGEAAVFVELAEFDSPKSYADLANSVRYAMNNIVPGKQAPDIVGKDADGRDFRLSDYRGNVVLLTFSANWCGGCVELYPLQRELVERYKDQPFVLLSVSRDENVDTLRDSIKSGKITWRCWWDGIDGPIRNSWNCEGIPSLILLDQQHVVQDVLLSRTSTREEFIQAISSILRKNAS